MNYKYYINDGLSNIEVFPINAGLETYDYERKNEADIVFQYVLNSELKFKYNDLNFNFKNQELSKCQELNLNIYKNCNGSAKIHWRGVFVITEGDFDDSRCTYTIKPRLKEDLIDDLSVNFLDEPNKVDEGGTVGVIINSITFPNARYFDKALLYIAKKCNPKINSIISNFFQINPTGPFYIPGVTNYWSKMVLFSASDIKNPPPSNPATAEYIKFSELMNDLFVLFQLYWYIDSGYNLRIESDLFFNGATGIDLTLTKYSRYMSGLNKYKYNLDDYPKKESWQIINHSRSASVIYGGLSNIKKDSNEKNYSTLKIQTDFFNLVNNPSSQDGILLVATDGGSFDGKYRAIDQAFLWPDYLVRMLHTRNRPALYALLTANLRNNAGLYPQSGGIKFDSVIPTKIQENIKFPLCCDDLFDPKDKIKTNYGLGKIDKASFDSKTNILNVTLKYSIDNCDDFIPSDLPGLDLWLKYNDFIYDPQIGPLAITTASQWNDSSGHNRHAVQAVLANRPMVIPDTPGGTSALFFSFNDLINPVIHHFFSVPAFQLFPNKRGTIFIIYKPFTNSYFTAIGNIPVVSTQDGGTDNYFDFTLLDPTGYHSYAEGEDYPLSQTFLGLQIIRRSANQNIDITCNNASVPSNPMQIANNLPDLKNLIIGSNRDVFGDNITGNLQIAEIIVYGRDLSDIEIENVELYLTKKGIYGIYP